MLVLGQWLYKYAPHLHRWLYFLYKNWSDRHEIHILKRFAKANATVLDIGANIGFYARLLSKLFGASSIIYAFEPHPENCKRFLKNTRGISNIHLNPVALGSENGHQALFLSDTLNVDHRLYKSASHARSISVPTCTLDLWLKERQINSIDFIKMDVQGFENNVLKGMELLLRGPKKPVILCELWPYGLHEAGNSASAMIKHLEKYKYDLFLLINNKEMPLNSQSNFQLDALPESKYFNLLALPRAT